MHSKDDWPATATGRPLTSALQCPSTICFLFDLLYCLLGGLFVTSSFFILLRHLQSGTTTTTTTTTTTLGNLLVLVPLVPG